MYHLVGVDYDVVFHDREGRPIPVLNHGQSIRELASSPWDTLPPVCHNGAGATVRSPLPGGADGTAIDY
jgi:hypothetical protein